MTPAEAEVTREREALYTLTDKLHRASSLDDIYSASLDAILSGLRCDRASILLYDVKGVMRFVAWRGLSDDYRAVAEGHSPWTRDTVNPEPVSIADAAQADLDAALKQRIALEGIRAAAFIPLVSEGVLIGKFMAYFNVPHEFTTSELALSLTIARQLTVALQRHRGEQALRATEERLRLATQTGKVGLWEWDIVNNHVIWSESLYHMHGVDPATFEPTLEGFSRLVHPEDLGLVTETLRRTLEENAPYELTFRIITPAGHTLWLYTTATVLRDGLGKPHRFVGAVTDVSHIKSAEETVRLAQEELKRADRRKDEFIAMLGHELRNPLAPIANAVHLLRLSPSTDTTQVSARAIIERQMGRLTRLVDDLLDVSRITSGRVQLHQERTPLEAVVMRAVETVRPLIEQEKHRLHVELTTEPVWIFGDLTRLEQVFANLLNNAAKYTDSGGEIWLGTALENGRAVVRVRDNGIGIASELLPQVFELFIQAERTLERSRGGLGVGLSLVKRLVQLHGGTVEARSTPGAGSEFTVSLPSIPAPATRAAPRDAARPNGAVARQLRVLVVDDNIDAAQSLGMVLQAGGHAVHLSHDGIAALEAAEAHKPDLVFLDIGLPRLNGYEVAKRLRAAPLLKSAMIVAMTGYGQPEDLRRSNQAGFDHHLVKPADPGRVEELLRERAQSLAN
jgi:PAS domain S-box-containing protein